MLSENKKTKPLFIGLYDSKLLGIRYLSSALKAHGYSTHLIFLKSFNSYRVDEPTTEEYELLYKTVRQLSPGYIGISIMCSFYLPVVKTIIENLRKLTDCKIILGGAYVTLFPQKCLAFSDVVFRGECEDAIVAFTNALENGEPYDELENIAVKTPDGQIRVNPLRPLIQELDRLPHPDFGGKHMYYINDNRVQNIDPHTQSHSYEMTTSRGCPNRCSYCSNSSLFELYKGKGKYIRQRTAADVLSEIKNIKTRNPGLQMLRFWDEIFPWDEDWLGEFAREYKKQINLPFEVWGHPRLSAGPGIKKLVEAGLSKIVIGVQSGSPQVRKEIYLRNETQEEILACSNALSAAKVPIVIFDFILSHPFETTADLQETFELCRRLAKPFRLQLHGLTFLPGTPIEEIAVARGVRTWEEIRAEQARPLKEQYHGLHWWRQGIQRRKRRTGGAGRPAGERNEREDRGGEQNAEKIYWYTLIYLTQFPTGEFIIRRALKKESLKRNVKPLLLIHRLYNYRLMLTAGTRKLKYILRSLLLRKPEPLD